MFDASSLNSAATFASVDKCRQPDSVCFLSQPLFDLRTTFAAGTDPESNEPQLDVMCTVRGNSHPRYLSQRTLLGYLTEIYPSGTCTNKPEFLISYYCTLFVNGRLYG
jgi:hypothetical protein